MCKTCTREEISHVGTLDRHGMLVAGGFKDSVEFLSDNNKSKIIYELMNNIFQKREELDSILGETDYAALRRTNFLLITVPERVDLLIVIIT